MINVVAIANARTRDELCSLFADAPWPECPELRWRLHPVPSIAAGLVALRKRTVAIVICDADAYPDWPRTLLPSCYGHGTPRLIVASRLADERFWAEALNLGACDVLARPWRTGELARTLRHAWCTWERDRRTQKTPPRTVTASPGRGGGL